MLRLEIVNSLYFERVRWISEFGSVAISLLFASVMGTEWRGDRRSGGWCEGGLRRFFTGHVSIVVTRCQEDKQRGSESVSGDGASRAVVSIAHELEKPSGQRKSR